MTAGGTVGIPITGGVGTGLLVAQPLKDTLLTLDRYSKIVGVIAPPHFYGSHGDTYFPIAGSCDAVVPRHGWQLPEVVSREEILEQIAIAEDELKEYLGYYVGPKFVVNDIRNYPRPYDRTVITSGRYNSALQEKSIDVDSGLVISAGVRGTTKIGTATTVGGSLTYTDEDGDGFAETANVTIATTETNVCELRCFITDTDAAPEWEIKSPKKKELDGSGNVVFQYHIWHFIDPDIDARYPTADAYRALDLTDTSNLLTSVDIYRVYVDNTQVSASFFWESDADCNVAGTIVDVSTHTQQDGVAIVRDVQEGMIVPRPATYDASQGIWTGDTWAVGRDPDLIRVSYYAGDISQAYLNGVTCDPLKEIYAKAIAYMATARLPRSICGCEGVLLFFERLRKDLARSDDVERFSISLRDLENPFGTRLGEVMAWRLIGKLRASRLRNVEVAVI